jgi:hypothetical protein
VRPASVVALIFTLGLALAGAARGQSLAEAARREQEKRKQTKTPPPRVYGEDDLKSLPPVPKSVASPAPLASPPPSASPEPDRALLEREWRARFREARARIAQEDARAYEDRVEVVFVSGIPVQQRVRVKVETPALKAAQQALADLEDELRRSGGLPGWGRE